jgi:hypothetical protein
MAQKLHKPCSVSNEIRPLFDRTSPGSFASLSYIAFQGLAETQPSTDAMNRNTKRGSKITFRYWTQDAGYGTASYFRYFPDSPNIQIIPNVAHGSVHGDPMELSPREAGSHPASEEITRLLWSPKVHYCVHCPEPDESSSHLSTQFP